MEATKALALKWKRKSSSLSLRRTSSSKSTKKEAKAAAEEARAQAARNSLSVQQDARRESEKIINTTAPTDSVPANSPPTLLVLPPSGNLDTPPQPSPSSDVSPTTQVPANGQAEHAKSPVPPATDYFTNAQLDSGEGGASPRSAPPNRVSFSFPNKEGGGPNGHGRPERQESPDEFENAVSSATPSTVASPRESVSIDDIDDGATDAGRSSIASFNGGGSRHSSISSPRGSRFPNGSAPQGRSNRGSISSRHKDSSDQAVPNSRYVLLPWLLLPGRIQCHF